MLKQILARVEIARPHNMAAAALGVLAGYFIGGGRGAANVLWVAVLTAVVTGAGNIVNDWHDAEIDRVNKPRRPIPSGRLDKRSAGVLYVAVTTTATVVAFLVLPRLLIAMIVVWEASLYLYARWAKRRFPAGNLMVAAVSSSAFLAGGIAAGNSAAVVVPLGIAFVFVLGRELVKGAEDVDGDAIEGAVTLAVAAGVERAGAAAAALMLVLAAALPLPVFAGYYGGAYFWIMELAVAPGLIVGAAMVARGPHRISFTRVAWLLKVEMFVGIVAVALGKT